MSLKIELVERVTVQKHEVSTVCRELGIARQTAHKWLKRFREGGYDALEERSRRPTSSVTSFTEDIVGAVIDTRDRHPSWGPRKIEIVLRKKFGAQTPSERTITRLLKRFERVRARRKKRPRNVVELAPDAHASASNDVWTVDFKGWWRTSDGARCDPLTVRDAFSRYVIAVEVPERGKIEDVHPIFEHLFRKYGIPRAIQCDNGVPFVSVHARGGLTKLSAWWVSLGIRLVRSRVASPQDNGGHERMHGDIARDVQSSPSVSRAAERRVLARWRQDFNHVRPHESLGNKCPAEVYVASPTRPRATRARYPPTWATRRVRMNGEITMHRERYFVSTALAGHDIGLEQKDAVRWTIWHRTMNLGDIEIAPNIDAAAIERRSVRSKSDKGGDTERAKTATATRRR